MSVGCSVKNERFLLLFPKCATILKGNWCKQNLQIVWKYRYSNVNSTSNSTVYSHNNELLRCSFKLRKRKKSKKIALFLLKYFNVCLYSARFAQKLSGKKSACINLIIILSILSAAMLEWNWITKANKPGVHEQNKYVCKPKRKKNDEMNIIKSHDDDKQTKTYTHTNVE